MVFDTTLRDGEQSLPHTLQSGEKLELARQLAKMGIDIIEAGFPASSPEDFSSVQLVADQVKGVIVCGLTRALRSDIDLCAQALKSAENPRIHTGIGVSPLHIHNKLHLTPELVVDQAVAAVRHAKMHLSDVEFYAEDALRADRSFLANIVEKVITAGATVVNIPDTVGYATPWEYQDLITFLKTRVANIGRAVISVHCHNDLGMATANTMAGVIAGAGQIEGTINGLGERAGNTALEEVIMALYTHSSNFKVATRIITSEIVPTSRLVAAITGINVPSYKAIVGTNAFNHASGIHQDGILKARATYEIISPEIIGAEASRIVLTSRSGRHALRYRLEQLGYRLEGEAIEEIYSRFLQAADQQREFADQDLHQLMV